MTGDEVVAFDPQAFEDLRRINTRLYGDGQSLDAQERTRLADDLARALAAGTKARVLP